METSIGGTIDKGKRSWKNYSSCKISNESVARIEISFKEKDIKYLEFLRRSGSTIKDELTKLP